MGVDSWFKFSIEPQRHRGTENQKELSAVLWSLVSFSLCLCVSVVPFLTSTLKETHGSLYTGAARAAMPVQTRFLAKNRLSQNEAGRFVYEENVAMEKVH